ncbi:unnamed protein product [Calypogeia fissa]
MALCRFIYKAIKIISSVSMDHLLMMLILFAFAFQSWNVSRRTEGAAYELVLATRTRFNTTSTTRHYAPKLLSMLNNLKSVTGTSSSLVQKELLNNRDIGGSRGLRFHEEINEVVLQPPVALSYSECTFEGMLTADGSISSVKLLMEKGNRFADYDNVHNTRRAQWRQRKHVNGQRAGKPQDSSISYDKKYPPCAEELRDLIPCLNSIEGHLFGRCPNVNRGLGSCVTLAPRFYARQFKWPASKNQVRGPNVPNVPLLLHHRASWMTPQGRSGIIYVGDVDPWFPNGTGEYVNKIAKMIQDLKFGKDVRVVLDIGCGSGNLAATLETQGVLTLCIAGAGSVDNGVQLVVERGYPALVQSLGTLRLPYPSQAFDLIHCAAGDVEWAEKGGLRLLEIDRILRAGGFFIWIDQSEVGANWNGMEKLTKNMCWRNVARWGGKYALWQKPTNQTCYLMRTLQTPPLCNASISTDRSWDVSVQSCIVGLPGTGGAVTSPWPIRLKTPPGRLEQTPAAGIEAAKAEAFTADLNYWVDVVAFYVVDFGPVRAREIHNVLDMNAGYGGFAAAVSMKTPPLQWWVLNVVPTDLPDRLAVIFDRGLLGLYHDWCESLDVYPRAFDMIHSSRLFSSSLRCDMSDIVQEMDRLLRPGGFAIIRDQEAVLSQVQIIVRAMHWKATMFDTDSGPKGKDKMLNCQKTFWRSNMRKSGRG